ncbi:MAG: EI24 domain-containing protein [Chitinophagaceae bacterium]|nr:EI24 domain-containing protein [Chitinophagaceae bacterium]MBK8786511.1 EI24 domain-containing protein [Chitinophagaceae bacterium]MBK9483984.1 EI24 domain-containing protein [Chitinophagaceae bacterium]
MLKEIVISLQAYYHTHRFIIKHRLWKWILIPGLIYAVLFCVGIYLFYISSSSAIEFMLQKSGIEEWIKNSWLSFLLIFAQIILNLILLLFYFSLFKYLFLIIGSPLFAYLSEKTESIIEGKEYPFSFKQLMKDMIRGIKLALRNMLWQTVYTVSILILSFIPIIGWVTPLLALLVECYYLGFSMLDYSCERNKLSTAQSIGFIGRHKGLAIGNGMVFYLMHFIPILGWLLAPSYAVIAATISLYNAKTEGLINVSGKINL